MPVLKVNMKGFCVNKDNSRVVGLTANEVCMSALSAKKNISNVRDSGSSDFKEQGSELKIPRLSSEVPIQSRLLHDRSRHRLLCAQTVKQAGRAQQTIFEEIRGL